MQEIKLYLYIKKIFTYSKKQKADILNIRETVTDIKPTQVCWISENSYSWWNVKEYWISGE